MQEPVKTVKIDDRLESYQQFFRPEVAARISEIAVGLPKLDTLLMDLLADWRSISYTVAFPAQLVHHMYAFAEHITGDADINTRILKFAGAAIKRLSMDVTELDADPGMKRKLHDSLVCIAAELNEQHGKTKLPFSPQDIWKDYQSHHVYQMTIWSSLRVCYVAVFNAYDNFVRQCVSAALGGRDIRSNDSETFKARIRECFGPSILQKCWTNDNIRLIRHTRHALTHAAGRQTSELQTFKHNYEVVEGYIQIFPSHVKSAYEILAKASLDLASDASKKTEFR